MFGIIFDCVFEVKSEKTIEAMDIEDDEFEDEEFEYDDYYSPGKL